MLHLEGSTGGLATSDVPLRSEISVSNRSIICFCSSATCWNHEIICEWPSGWLCGKRLRGAERHEHGLRVCDGDKSGDSTGGNGERTGGRGDSGVHDNGEMVLWVIEVQVVAVALVMVSIVSGTFVGWHNSFRRSTRRDNGGLTWFLLRFLFFFRILIPEAGCYRFLDPHFLVSVVSVGC